MEKLYATHIMSFESTHWDSLKCCFDWNHHHPLTHSCNRALFVALLHSRTPPVLMRVMLFERLFWEKHSDTLISSELSSSLSSSSFMLQLCNDAPLSHCTNNKVRGGPSCVPVAHWVAVLRPYCEVMMNRQHIWNFKKAWRAPLILRHLAVPAALVLCVHVFKT